MEDLYAELVTTGQRLLEGHRTWAGVNPAPAAPGVAIYVVDATGLVADNKTCGGKPSAASGSGMCKRALAVTDNCAVVGSRTVACDMRFLWRLRRAAMVLTLSHIKNPKTKQYYFDRVALRNKFLSGEGTRPEKEQVVANLKDLNRFLGLGLVQPHVEDFKRVQSGFVRFVLAHELGHVVKDHAAGAGFVPCAEATAEALQGQYNRACDEGSEIENDADEFAISVLAEGVVPDRYTPERAIPELFIEQHERRSFLAMKACGLDPATAQLGSLAAEARRCFDEALFRYTVTETHPTHLRRYVRFMRLLQKRNVQLTVSLQQIDLAEQFGKKVQAWCDQP
jgi:hypothetical protein